MHPENWGKTCTSEMSRHHIDILGVEMDVAIYKADIIKIFGVGSWSACVVGSTTR